MKEYPIMFTAEMVLAVLNRTKSQTRRVIRNWFEYDLITFANGRWQGEVHSEGAAFVHEIKCPYGEAGDHLWVRERQKIIGIKHSRYITDEGTCAIKVEYEADGAQSDWIVYPDRLNMQPEIGKCLPYGGYRESSRITLLNKGVRAEKVQCIGVLDAIAEGVERVTELQGFPDGGWRDYSGASDGFPLAQKSFESLWQKINGLPRANGVDISWGANPDVWAIKFEMDKDNTMF